MIGYEYCMRGKLLTYEIRVRPRVSGKVRHLDVRDRECVGVVISNLLSCIRKGSVLVYSRNKNENTTNRKKITVRRVIRAVEDLERLGYVDNFIGRGSAIKEFRIISHLIPTDKLKKEFNVTDIKVAEQDYLDYCPVIELRDEDKNMVNYKLDDKVKGLAETVRKLNQTNEDAVILDGDGNPLTNIYCRIFNENFDLGGRYYRADVLTIKNRGTNDRLKITIDGESVCEVDYSNLHFRIAAAQMGIPNDMIPEDVYSELLEDSSNKVERQIIKYAVNILFNCNKESSAIGAIQKEINFMSKEDKEQYTLGNAKSVISLIRDSYPEFAYLFCNEEGFGLYLQNADSHLATTVIEEMVGRGIVCLPIHDSFVVPLKHLNLLCEVMADSFRKLFDKSAIVPLGIKYFDNGVLVDEKVIV